jgi:hypothetical protein
LSGEVGRKRPKVCSTAAAGLLSSVGARNRGGVERVICPMRALGRIVLTLWIVAVCLGVYVCVHLVT